MLVFQRSSPLEHPAILDLIIYDYVRELVGARARARAALAESDRLHITAMLT